MDQRGSKSHRGAHEEWPGYDRAKVAKEGLSDAVEVDVDHEESAHHGSLEKRIPRESREGTKDRMLLMKEHDACMR